MSGPDTRGSVFRTRTTGEYGIRWPEDGKRPQKIGFATKTAARAWFAANVAPRLRDGTPDPSITYDDFCTLYLARWGPTVMPRTVATMRERLVASRDRFGAWPLRDLEGAAGDVARWRAGLTDSSRYRLTLAMRQALNAAVRWKYLRWNPVADAGPNPEPRSDELMPFTRAEVDMIAAKIGPVYGPLVVFAAETGLRTAEWVGLERRDVDRAGRAVVVQRRVSDGVMTPFGKTQASRRRVPLTKRALAALDALPPRLDTPLVFPAPEGGYVQLDNWRVRWWYDALEDAGLAQRGPYSLRHSFATWSLAAGLSIFEISRLMGTSVRMIDRTYGHLAHDAHDAILDRLDTAAAQPGVNLASSPDPAT